LVTVLILAALAVLPALYVWEARRVRRGRAAFFAPALALFDRYRVTQDGAYFPVLEGRYRGFDVRLEPVLDDMTWRKLPSLWLKATVLNLNPSRGTLDFLVRPQGGEFYSPAADMAQRVPVPQGWPQHAILCTDRRETMPPLDILTAHMTAFEDPRTKELVITPRGVRLVYQAAQGDRASYLVLRQAKFAAKQVDQNLVSALLDRVIAIAQELDQAVPAMEAA
jgi:hypothetical protein